MKYFNQIAWLMLFWAVGECVSEWLRPWFPIPGTIAGMLLLFAALCMGIIKEETVRDASDFLLSNIAFFFIPACISILEVDKALWTYFPALMGIAVVTTLITMAVSGRCAQWVMKWRHPLE